MTQGGPLEEPLAAFVHNLPSADSAREVWHILLLLAALLFPLDVALRRVMLSPRDLQKARDWVKTRIPGGSVKQRRAEPILGQLFSARERARSKTERRAPDTPKTTAPAGSRPVSPPAQPPAEAPARPPQPDA